MLTGNIVLETKRSVALTNQTQQYTWESFQDH